MDSEPARPGRGGAGVPDDEVVLAGDRAKDVCFEDCPHLLANQECPHYCHSPRRPATILRRAGTLASSPCTGAVTTTSMRDQNRFGSCVIAGLPSRRLKKLPHRPRSAIGTTVTGRRASIR